MGVSGIESAIDRTLEQLSGNKELRREVKQAFLELLDQVLVDAGARSGVAGAADTPPAASTPAATTLFPTTVGPEVSEASEAPRLAGGFAREFLVDPGQPALTQLPDTLEAGDAKYNERESLLRARLDLPALERRLRASAESLGIAYSPEDLNGVLRNAGYDAVHLGSSERYMAAIERGMLSAEETHRRGAFNIPGVA